ncbi:hypothetical protein B0H34DRAFT_671991 [Crassisporium funariophilum]|nr:hypothetical protein B0H34DRAFT_671991 [Crassisporium funariophilum]
MDFAAKRRTIRYLAKYFFSPETQWHGIAVERQGTEVLKKIYESYYRENGFFELAVGDKTIQSFITIKMMSSMHSTADVPTCMRSVKGHHTMSMLTFSTLLQCRFIANVVRSNATINPGDVVLECSAWKHYHYPDIGCDAGRTTDEINRRFIDRRMYGKTDDDKNMKQTDRVR